MGELNSALSSGKDVKLSGNIDSSEDIVKIESNNTLDGQGNTMISDQKRMITTTGGTIKNIIIDGKNLKSATAETKRGIFNDGKEGTQKATADVNLENVTFTGLGYAFNLYAESGSGAKLSVIDCNIEGWSSFTGFDSAIFESCKFTMGNYFTITDPLTQFWNGCVNCHVNTVFEDCDFENGFKIGSGNGTTPTITFKNCRLDGVDITSSNVSNLYADSGMVITVI